MRLGLGPAGRPERELRCSVGVARRRSERGRRGAFELPSGAYNVSDDEPLRHRDYVDALANAPEVKHPKLPPLWATRARRLGRQRDGSGRSEYPITSCANPAAVAPKFPSAREGWRATGQPAQQRRGPKKRRFSSRRRRPASAWRPFRPGRTAGAWPRQVFSWVGVLLADRDLVFQGLARCRSDEGFAAAVIFRLRVLHEAQKSPESPQNHRER